MSGPPAVRIGRIEYVAVVAPVGFRVVHRGVGGPDQGLGVPAVVREEADADAQGDPQSLRTKAVGPLHGMQQLPAEAEGILDLLDLRQKDDEFVAALAADRVGEADAGKQPAGGGLQDLVAGRVPEGVVDGLEMIQVQEEQADLLAMVMAHGGGMRMTERLLEEVFYPAFGNAALAARLRTTLSKFRVIKPLK